MICPDWLRWLRQVAPCNHILRQHIETVPDFVPLTTPLLIFFDLLHQYT